MFSGLNVTAVPTSKDFELCLLLVVGSAASVVTTSRRHCDIAVIVASAVVKLGSASYLQVPKPAAARQRQNGTYRHK